jgi:glyoxylase-like metal-dependent hydrolase (beta-lactamase superfamily II)
MRRGLLLVFLSLALLVGSASAAASPTASVPKVFTGYVLSAGNGKATILTQGAVKEFAIAPDVKVVAFSGGIAFTGALAEYALNDAGQIKYFNAVVKLESSTDKDGKILYEPGRFDDMKYGKQTSDNRLVAAGWLCGNFYPKGFYNPANKELSPGQLKNNTLVQSLIGNEISVGDYALWNEEYKLAENAVIYAVSLSNPASSRVSDLASLRAAQKTIDQTAKDRTQVYVVFDRDYTDAKNALATEVYYFTEPFGALDLKGAFTSFRHFYSQKGIYTQGTEPFEVIPGRLYHIGDTKNTVYLINSDKGLILFDAGNPNCEYQYMTNIEKLGFDPREIKYIYTSHGHGDHFGSVYAFVEMLQAAGKPYQVWGMWEDLYGYSAKEPGMPSWQNIIGSIYEPGPNFQEKMYESTTKYVSYLKDGGHFYPYDKWFDMGGVRFYCINTPGHTVGTGSFFTEFTLKSGQKVVSFYHGGYGVNGLTDPKVGGDLHQEFRRLTYAYNLAYVEMLAGEFNCTFLNPQHGDQFPICELNQKAISLGKTYWECYNPSVEEVINFCEKRYQVMTWGGNGANDPVKGPFSGSIKDYGPNRRPLGAKNVETKVYKVLVLHGFDMYQAKNPNLPGFEKGLVTWKDYNVNDPDGWYVQLLADVKDDYDGIIANSGPVEAQRDTLGDGSVLEVIRTVRLGSRAEADRIAAAIKVGSSYQIDLDKLNQITGIAAVFQASIK